MQFTLRDIMAAMAVICLLIVLIPPWLDRGVSRTPGNSNICRNNLRNLGLSIIQYEVHRGQYPGYNNDLDPSTAGSPNNKRSWTFVILPYMDHRSTYDRLTAHELPNWYDSQGRERAGGIFLDLELTMCPSLPKKRFGPGATVYVVNTGQLDRPATATRAADSQYNGVFHTGVRISPEEKLVANSAADIARGGGLGMTLMMAENADARHWTDTAERWTGFTYHHADGIPGPAVKHPKSPMGLNVRRGRSAEVKPQNATVGFARPSSYHPGGFNVAFCDGHVRFLGDKMSYRVYQALMTPIGAQAVDNSSQTPFEASHGAASAVDETKF